MRHEHRFEEPRHALIEFPVQPRKLRGLLLRLDRIRIACSSRKRSRLPSFRKDGFPDGVIFGHCSGMTSCGADTSSTSDTSSSSTPTAALGTSLSAKASSK